MSFREPLDDWLGWSHPQLHGSDSVTSGATRIRSAELERRSEVRDPTAVSCLSCLYFFQVEVIRLAQKLSMNEHYITAGLLYFSASFFLMKEEL